MVNPKFIFNVITTSGVPIYRQIQDQIKTLIATGRLTPDEFLPSVRQVAQELEINPMTVSKAYSILEREGVLENVRGQGMKIIASKHPLQNLNNRQQVIKPLLRQVISTATQLSLQPKIIIDLLNLLWKEQKE